MKVGDLVINKDTGAVGVVLLYSPEVPDRPVSPSNPTFMKILLDSGIEWIVGKDVGTDKSSWEVIDENG
jgi:hypothetical protein